ncbi:MAG: GNAT family N-acetyltransferase [Janthinobacterium lividum]
MQPFLTPRLLLRPLEVADAPGLYALDSDPAVQRYLGGIGGPGQGYGYEAAQAWLACAFGSLGLPRVCAYADVENAGSRRILEKIGLALGPTFVENGTRCAWYEARNPAQAASSHS